MIYTGSGFRRLVAAYTIYYGVTILPDLELLFGSSGMVNENLLQTVGPSVFLFSRSSLLLWGATLLLIVLSGRLFIGHLSRWGLFTLYTLLVSFWNANPYVIHEPHQIHSFFILTLFFWPLSDEKKVDPFIRYILCFFLGLYYFVAGLKKLPDPNWISGDALLHILNWQAVSFHSLKYSDNVFITIFFKLANWSVLFFEMTFFILVMTKWRRYILILGTIFHLTIKLFLDVGPFAEIMLVWYGAHLYPQDWIDFKLFAAKINRFISSNIFSNISLNKGPKSS